MSWVRLFLSQQVPRTDFSRQTACNHKVASRGGIACVNPRGLRESLRGASRCTMSHTSGFVQLLAVPLKTKNHHLEKTVLSCLGRRCNKDSSFLCAVRCRESTVQETLLCRSAVLKKDSGNPLKEGNLRQREPRRATVAHKGANREPWELFNQLGPAKSKLDQAHWFPRFPR